LPPLRAQRLYHVTLLRIAGRSLLLQGLRTFAAGPGIAGGSLLLQAVGTPGNVPRIAE